MVLEGVGLIVIMFNLLGLGGCEGIIVLLL